MTTKEELKEYMQQGWELEDQNQYMYKLTKNKGKMWVHILLLCSISIPFMLIPNIAYWFMSRKKMTIMRED